MDYTLFSASFSHWWCETWPLLCECESSWLFPSRYLRAGRLTLLCLPLSILHFLLSGSLKHWGRTGNGPEQQEHLTRQQPYNNLTTIPLWRRKCLSFVQTVSDRCWFNSLWFPNQPKKQLCNVFCGSGGVLSSLRKLHNLSVWPWIWRLRILTKEKKGAVSEKMLNMFSNTFFLWNITDPFGKPWICRFLTFSRKPVLQTGLWGLKALFTRQSNRNLWTALWEV